MRSQDYYSKVQGYVIDGQPFGFSLDRASTYLVQTAFMDADEAVSYLHHLNHNYYHSGGNRRENNTRVKGGVKWL